LEWLTAALPLLSEIDNVKHGVQHALCGIAWKVSGTRVHGVDEHVALVVKVLMGHRENPYVKK
jgi:hypothetical protein